MRVWRGKGLQILIILFVSSFMVSAVTGAIMHNPRYYDEVNWAFGLSLLISAAVIWIMEKSRSSEKLSQLMDTQIDEIPKVQKEKSSLFLIPIRYWPLILSVIGLYLIIADFL